MKTFGRIIGVILLVVIVAVAGVMGKNIAKSLYHHYEQSNQTGELEQMLRETAKNINQQLPIMVDSETRLDTVLVQSKQMYYKYSLVKSSKDQIEKKEFDNAMKNVLSRNHCDNQETRKLLKLGIEYFYIYFDKNGALVSTINISQRDCN